MGLIKIAKQKSWTQRHPLIAGGIALTGGIAAADMGIGIRKNLLNKVSWKHELGEHAKEGLLYGGILSAAEPAILYGALRHKNEE